jgi:hypothetical protein
MSSYLRKVFLILAVVALNSSLGWACNARVNGSRCLDGSATNGLDSYTRDNLSNWLQTHYGKSNMTSADWVAAASKLFDMVGIHLPANGSVQNATNPITSLRLNMTNADWLAAASKIFDMVGIHLPANSSVQNATNPITSLGLGLSFSVTLGGWLQQEYGNMTRDEWKATASAFVGARGPTALGILLSIRNVLAIWLQSNYGRPNMSDADWKAAATELLAAHSFFLKLRSMENRQAPSSSSSSLNPVV